MTKELTQEEKEKESRAKRDVKLDKDFSLSCKRVNELKAGRTIGDIPIDDEYWKAVNKHHAAHSSRVSSNLRKGLAILLMALLGATIGLNAQSTGRSLTTGTSQAGIVVAYANEAITVDNTSGGKGFTSSLINPTCTNCPVNTLRATVASCFTEATSAAQLRFSVTSTAPTSTVGSLVTSGSTITVYGYANILAFRAIRTASTSIPMYCTYYRPN